ncbi:MAG TPA: DUF4232 domain-containing protein [Streptosporangiaceae bacterium]|jgi:hypothetical protein|nr:DUF4232 domain-containing protein [Streptosporangiaceae bacterium]
MAVAAAAFICLVTVTAACSSSSSTPAAVATTTVTASPTTPAASTATATTGGSGPVSSPAACQTTSLQVKQGLAQGYAGGVYEVIDFTNTSTSPCTLYGYPGVSLVSGPPYTQIGLSAKRSTTSASAPVKLITLAPGATANALLQIVDALNYPPATCGPTKATALKVYPPNQTVPVYLANTSTACTKSVQIMNIGAVQAGAGGST